MTHPRLAPGLLALAVSLLSSSAAAQDAPPAEEERADQASSAAAPEASPAEHDRADQASSAAAPEASPAEEDDAEEPSGEDDAEEPSGEDAGEPEGPPPPRSERRRVRIRGGAGLGGLAAIDAGGSGPLAQVEGRIGVQLSALFGVYAQLGVAAGDLGQERGGEGRAAFATFSVLPELHPLDELAIGLGPAVMVGARDLDQEGPRYRDGEALVSLRDDRDEELVARFGAMLRVSPAIGRVRPSGRIHAFRPSLEVAVLGTPREVVAPEEPVMVTAGMSFGWDTW